MEEVTFPVAITFQWAENNDDIESEFDGTFFFIEREILLKAISYDNQRI